MKKLLVIALALLLLSGCAQRPSPGGSASSAPDASTSEQPPSSSEPAKGPRTVDNMEMDIGPDLTEHGFYSGPVNADGKPDGEGVFVYSGRGDYDGCRCYGTFVDGSFEGEFTLYFMDGDSFEGEMHGKDFCGPGEYWMADGGVLRGNFSDSLTAEGIYMDSEGTYFRGDVQEGHVTSYEEYDYAPALDAAWEIGKSITGFDRVEVNGFDINYYITGPDYKTVEENAEWLDQDPQNRSRWDRVKKDMVTICMTAKEALKAAGYGYFDVSVNVVKESGYPSSMLSVINGEVATDMISYKAGWAESAFPRKLP